MCIVCSGVAGDPIHPVCHPRLLVVCMQLLLQPSSWKVGGRQGPRAGQARDSWHYPGAAGVAQECSHALAGHDEPGRAGFSKMWLGSWRRRGPTLPGRRCPTRSSTFSTRRGGSGTLGCVPPPEVRDAFEPAALPLAVPANHTPLSRFTDEVIQHVHRKPEAKL